MANIKMKAADLVVEVEDEEMSGEELSVVADREMKMMMRQWVAADESLIKCSPEWPTFTIED
ncbi:hypothetical protein OB955_04850 [Halobacteria archaeon AArc-m2/3/4]|uniref:Uncharacterized protein n=1 Tax=Natronoglomus mannanivorans TaxID=2979990 RepID=A0ABT2QAW1_9EURY|nr:hypothetical protein [Halobacteria archaeon AArc-m2/3/4]